MFTGIIEDTAILVSRIVENTNVHFTFEHPNNYSLKEVFDNWTARSQDWESWNRFLIENPRGIYLQTKEWIKRYRAYGFSPFLLIAKDSESNILGEGGIGAILAKVGPFKVLKAPYGPIITCGLENLASPLIESFKNLAQSKGVFLAQVSFPAESTDENYHSAHLLSSKLSVILRKPYYSNLW